MLQRRTPLAPRRKRKRTIKAERQEDPAYLDRVRALPCRVCGATPSEPHHPKGLEFCAAGEKADDHDAFLLCPTCHRTGRRAFHLMGSKAWERLFGPQRDHVAATRATLGSMKEVFT